MCFVTKKQYQIWRDLIESYSQHILKFYDSNSKSKKNLRKSVTKVKNQGFSMDFVRFWSILVVFLFKYHDICSDQTINSFVFGNFFHIEKISEIIWIFVSGKLWSCRNAEKYFGVKFFNNSTLFLCILPHTSINFLQISGFPRKPSKCMENDGFWCLSGQYRTIFAKKIKRNIAENIFRV